MTVPFDYHDVNKHPRPISTFGLGIDEISAARKDLPSSIPVSMKERLLKTGRIIMTERNHGQNYKGELVYGTFVINNPSSSAEMKYWLQYRGFEEKILGRITINRSQFSELLHIPEEEEDIYKNSEKKLVETNGQASGFLLEPIEKVDMEYVRI